MKSITSLCSASTLYLFINVCMFFALSEKNGELEYSIINECFVLKKNELPLPEIVKHSITLDC